MADLSDSSKPLGSEADEHLSRLLVDQIENPWYWTFLTDVKEAIFPPKLPPLELTSQPVAVKDIWGLYGRQKKSFVASAVFQGAVVVAAYFIFQIPAVQVLAKHTVELIAPDLSPAPEVKANKGGGGGGDRSLLPASKGRLPKIAPRQFTPPSQVANNLNPKLPMDPSILAPPDIAMPNNNMSNYGDPTTGIGALSNGPGWGGGIGSGRGGGIGSGTGGGLGPGSGGGFGDGVYKVGKGTTAPVLLYKKEPEYSEEARKAKFQGTVMLAVEVDASGRAINLRVVRSLGLGLDEKAMEAVRQWKFKPGYHDGKPVTVAATIEVNFRLL
jgi:TonB family protein